MKHLKTFESFVSEALTSKEKSIIDDRLSYYFDNNEQTDDIDELVGFVLDGGEIASSKYKDVVKYIESNM